MGPHGFDNGCTGVIQINQDVARIAILRVGMDEHVAAFPVANAQEPDGGRMGQLGSGPQSLSGECSSGLGVNEADEIEVVRHGPSWRRTACTVRLSPRSNMDPILESRTIKD